MEDKLKTWEELKSLVADLDVDFNKTYYKRYEAASVRVTKGMQELKILAQKVRLDIFSERLIIEEEKKVKKQIKAENEVKNKK
jgi:hypothetical protein